MPKCQAPKIVNAADVCGAKPCYEVMRAIFIPKVSMILQLPKSYRCPWSARNEYDPPREFKHRCSAASEHGECEQTHESLAVIEPMIEGDERSREEWQPIEGAPCRRGRDDGPGR